MTGDVEVMGGKTGFITKAGYCLATLLRLPHRQPGRRRRSRRPSNNGRFWEKPGTSSGRNRTRTRLATRSTANS